MGQSLTMGLHQVDRKPVFVANKDRNLEKESCEIGLLHAYSKNNG